MLGESGHEREIRVQADNALREFLLEIKNAPVSGGGGSGLGSGGGR